MKNVKRIKYEPIYKKLLAWQAADELVKHVYTLTKNFQKEETFGITSQLRRAALSVVLNIIEGYSRNGKKEFKQFTRISLGSLAEASYLMEFSYELGYIDKDNFDNLWETRERCGELLWKFYKSL